MCVSPLGAAAPAGSLALVCVFSDADKRLHKGVLSQPCQPRDPGPARAPCSRAFSLRVSQEEESVAVPINKDLIKLGPTPERQPERQNGAKDKTPGWKVGEGGQSGGQRLTACLCRPSRAVQGRSCVAPAASWPFVEATPPVERVLPTRLRSWGWEPGDPWNCAGVRKDGRESAGTPGAGTARNKGTC